MFFSLLAISETNAFLAHSQLREANGLERYSRNEWKMELARVLVSDPFEAKMHMRITVQPPSSIWTLLGGHVGAMPRADKRVKVCRVCS